MIISGGMQGVPMIGGGGAGMGLFEIGDLLPSRDAVALATAELDKKILVLAGEIFASDIPAGADQTQTFLEAWNRFIDDWKAWKGTWYMFTRDRRDELFAFRRTYNDMYETFKRVGGKPVTVTAEPYTPEQISAPGGGAPQAPPSKWHSTIKWVATAAIVVGGAYALGKVAGVLGPLTAPGPGAAEVKL